MKIIVPNVALTKMLQLFILYIQKYMCMKKYWMKTSCLKSYTRDKVLYENQPRHALYQIMRRLFEKGKKGSLLL